MTQTLRRLHSITKLQLTIALFILQSSLCLHSETTSPMHTYTNPVIDDTLADPSVLYHDGMFYLYATGNASTYRVYTSTDLVEWEKGPVVYNPGIKNLWAPDVYYHPENQTFYIYDSADFTIGVASGDSPLGPFKRKTQLVERAIDAHLFRDTNGRLYLYYTLLPSFSIYVQKMKDPVTPDGDPTPLIKPELPWETASHRITEGPFVLKHQDTYYMMYSGSGAKDPNYAIGYATSAHPTGPFRKAPHNPIMKRSDGIFGPGHNSLITLPSGEIWIVYHQKMSDKIGYDRKICIERLRITNDGRMTATPTRGTAQPAPIIDSPPTPEASPSP